MYYDVISNILHDAVFFFTSDFDKYSAMSSAHYRWGARH